MNEGHLIFVWISQTKCYNSFTLIHPWQFPCACCFQDKVSTVGHQFPLGLIWDKLFVITLVHSDKSPHLCCHNQKVSVNEVFGLILNFWAKTFGDNFLRMLVCHNVSVDVISDLLTETSRCYSYKLIKSYKLPFLSYHCYNVSVNRISRHLFEFMIKSVDTVIYWLFRTDFLIFVVFSATLRSI